MEFCNNRDMGAAAVAGACPCSSDCCVRLLDGCVCAAATVQSLSNSAQRNDFPLAVALLHVPVQLHQPLLMTMLFLSMQCEQRHHLQFAGASQRQLSETWGPFLLRTFPT